MSESTGKSVPENRAEQTGENPYDLGRALVLAGRPNIPPTRNAQRRERLELLRQIERIGDLQYIALVVMHDEESAAMHGRVIEALMPRLARLNAALAETRKGVRRG